MLNKLLAITRFKNIWLVLPLLLVVLYIPQALWGLHHFGDKSAEQLIMIMILGLFVYCGTYLALMRIWSARSDIPCTGGPIRGGGGRLPGRR